MLSLPARTTLPLARHARVYTADFDEAAELYSRFVTPVRLARSVRRAPFSWRAHGLSIGLLGVTANELVGGVRAASAGPVRDYHLSIPLGAARGEATSAKGVFPMQGGRAGLVSSPGQHADVVLLPGFQALGLTIPSAALAGAIGTLTGAAPRPVRFLRTLALDAARTAPFLKLLRELVARIDQEPAALACPEVAARQAEALLFQLLLCHPHSETSTLFAPVQPAEPRYVRRAVEYLEAHLARTITMAELTRETGVGARSLQLGFQRNRGCSPLRFLQARRLQRARILLLTGDAQTGVSQAAHQAGFQHMGRFSVQYRQRFGETPTRTLARRTGK